MADAHSEQAITKLTDAIWGPIGNLPLLRKRLRTLMGDTAAIRVSLDGRNRNGYLTIVADETSSARRPIMSVDAMVELVRVLKSRPQVLRKDLEFNQEGHRLVEDTMLDRAVRTMLLTESSNPSPSRGAIFRPFWKADESLESFIRRVYPKDPQFHFEDHSPIQSTKLSARYFQLKNVRIKIVWTRFLTDHLVLSNDNRTLHVFGYPGFLHTSLSTVPLVSRGDDSLASALGKGCLPYDLLAETMRSYDILFPASDPRAQQWLSREIRTHSLDTMLSRRPPYSQIHNSPQDISTPRDVSSLCSRYPYWGRRLYDLWREVNEPNPKESWTEMLLRTAVYEWILANPVTTWFLNVIGGVSGLIAGWISAIMAIREWMAERPQPPPQIIYLPDSCNPLKRKQKKACKIVREQQDFCKAIRDQQDACKIIREQHDSCKVYENQEKED